MCSPQGRHSHKVTVPCLLCLGLIKRTHKNFRFFNSFPVCQERRAAIPPTASPYKLKEGDVGWESLEWLLWESPSLSGCFPALFPFCLQPVCCVCILKASEILRKEEPRSWAGSFLAMPGLGGCSKFSADPELVGHRGGEGVVRGVCCRVPFSAELEVPG